MLSVDKYNGLEYCIKNHLTYVQYCVPFSAARCVLAGLLIAAAPALAA